MANKSKNKASVFYAIISNTIVLVLIGLFFLLYFHTNTLTGILKERINIIIELKKETSQNEIKSIVNYLKKEEGVIASNIKHIPASEAKNVLGGDALELDLGSDSPFLDVLVFNVTKDFYNDSYLKRISGQLKSQPMVSDVIYENLVIDNIKSNLNKIAGGVLLLNLFFLILVVVIMYNTINLSLYADRWEIKTMEIIGARDNFIRQPYLKIAGRIGMVSFVISTFIILLFLGLAYYNVDLIAVTLKLPYLILTIGILFILSMMITIISTISIVNNYLQKEEEELYNS